MLKLKNLCFSYSIRKHFYLPKEEIPILQNISLELGIGDNLLIYGSSGSGKSTLAKCIAGLLPATSGEIYLGGQRLRGIHPHSIQYIFQDAKTALNPHTSIRSQLQRTLHNFSLPHSPQSLLHSFGLSPHILDLKPKFLSNGEAQRCSILQAILASPRILICDEITASLDEARARSILALLQAHQEQARREGRAMSCIFISHDEDLFSPLTQHTLKL